MIVDTVRGDVLQQSRFRHIAFVVNIDGHNDFGFAKDVSVHYWPELNNADPRKPGDVMSKSGNDWTFHALFCCSLGPDGWERTTKAVSKCLNSLDVPNDETIAFVLGNGRTLGLMEIDYVFSILGGVARSKKRVAIFAL